MESSEKKSSPLLKIGLFGCGGCGVVVLLVVVALGVWIANTPEGGVKLANEMDEYALTYLEEHQLLEPGEQLIAYYDVTMSMNSSEAAILTDRRVIYHKEGRTNSINLSEVTHIDHRYESLVGDVIEIQDSNGRSMKIEIAPLNQGETFKKALARAWEKAGAEES